MHSWQNRRRRPQGTHVVESAASTGKARNRTNASVGTHHVMDIHACMLTVLVAVQEKLNTKTVNEELTNDPELLKQVDDEISKGSYY